MGMSESHLLLKCQQYMSVPLSQQHTVSSYKFKFLPAFSDGLGSHKVRKELKRCHERVNIVRK